MSGALHLIPVFLGDSPATHWLPDEVRRTAARLTCYIAENAKTARAFLKLIGTDHPLQSIQIHTLSKKTSKEEMLEWLRPIQAGQEVGLVSEAGCPAVADPGALVVSLAHAQGLLVKPWVGPSSILLGLMASGLDGQRFAFHGYAPVTPAERAQQLKQWEQASAKLDQTQILIETPYRNGAMFESLLASLKPGTRLCIARSLSSTAEWVRTLDIGTWRTQKKPDLDKHPTLFLFQA
ncbi:MAG: SAM-dependent methyltransferase [Pigmentiphaga sp.]|nr:SAM-dependent methyltransferase [Pigmentiphaga sp.]